MKKETKWIRVGEYAKANNLTTAAVYKRIKLNQLESKKEYGLTLVKA